MIAGLSSAAGEIGLPARRSALPSEHAAAARTAMAMKNGLYNFIGLSWDRVYSRAFTLGKPVE
jgi:hypothetical protein